MNEPLPQPPTNARTGDEGDVYALILAGGSGTRLWPRSRTRHPKQFIDLAGSRTMLQEALDRIEPLIPAARVLVGTGRDYGSIVAGQLPSLPRGNVLGEPSPRGTAAAIGLAAVHLHRRDPHAVMVVLTADHLIAKREPFLRALAQGAALAREGWLVTLGIRPSHPETGYGYIHRGEPLSSGGASSAGSAAGPDGQAYRVARFVEKPDRANAERFLASGEYAWNSGMFVWRVDRILEEMARHLPELHGGLQAIGRSIGSPDEIGELERVWPAPPNETIDYGIMEKAERVAVLPVEIGWNDVGSWDALYEVLPHDAAGNAVSGAAGGTHVLLDTRGSFIHSDKRVIACVGMEDLIVVDTADALLICPRSRAQDVKQVVAQLQQRGAGAAALLAGEPPSYEEPGSKR